MKNQLKLVLAVAVFTATTLFSVQNSFARQRASGGCNASQGECGYTAGGEQICGTWSGSC